MDIVSSRVDWRFVICFQERCHSRHSQYSGPLKEPFGASVLVKPGNCVAEQVLAFAACVASAAEVKRMTGMRVCAEVALEAADWAVGDTHASAGLVVPAAFAGVAVAVG